MKMKETDFICRLSTEKIDEFSNIIFIGNGAVEGGVKPLLDWFDFIHDGKENKDLTLKKIDFSTILAAFSIKMRALRISESDSSLKDLYKFKEKKEYLAKMYYNASNSKRIKERETPDCIKNYLNHDDTLVICSNWDSVFWDLKKNKVPLIKNIIQIHGSCYNPSTIIFPCEYVMDYSKEVKHHLLAPDIPYDYLSTLLGIHSIAIRALESKNLKKMFFWGLSLNDYDAEIMAIIEVSFSERRRLTLNNPKMWVINPDIKAAYRISYLTEIFEFIYVDPIGKKNKTIKI